MSEDKNTDTAEIKQEKKKNTAIEIIAILF